MRHVGIPRVIAELNAAFPALRRACGKRSERSERSERGAATDDAAEAYDARLAAADALVAEYGRLLEQLAGGPLPVVGHAAQLSEWAARGSAAGTGLPAAADDALPVPAAHRRREELTAQQLQALDAVRSQTAEQDHLLDAIGAGADELLRIAQDMGDELELQSKMLADLDGKADKVGGKAAATADRAGDALRRVRGGLCCVYLVCVVLLLIVASVLFTMITNKT
jgi:hypothetical protein